MSDQYENLTDEELARDLYLATIRPDDKVHDPCSEEYLPAVHMAAALWGRLRGPYCKVPGCPNLHTPSFPVCAEHLALE
jgi:hypothetical protein